MISGGIRRWPWTMRLRMPHIRCRSSPNSRVPFSRLDIAEHFEPGRQSHAHGVHYQLLAEPVLDLL